MTMTMTMTMTVTMTMTMTVTMAMTVATAVTTLFPSRFQLSNCKHPATMIRNLLVEK
jgi:hypothetical protein